MSPPTEERGIVGQTQIIHRTFAGVLREKTRGSAAFELVATGRRGNSIGAFGLLQRRIGIRLDANVYLRSLCKTHFITVLVSQGVLDANPAIKIVPHLESRSVPSQAGSEQLAW